jgi:hypothetical protein
MGDVLGGFAAPDQLDGPDATTLQFFGGPDGSHTIGTISQGDRFG